MKGPRLLIALFLLATVLVDMAVFAMAADPVFPPPAKILFFSSLAQSQVSLLAIWAGLGSKRTPWRLLGTIAGALLWSWLVASAEGSRSLRFELNTTSGGVVMLAQALAIVVPLSIARWAGIRPVQVSHKAGSPTLDAGRRRLQFSLANLFGWITSAALLLSMLPYVVHYDQLERVPAFSLRFAMLISSAAALGLAALWAVLGTRRPLLRVVVLCVITGTLIAVGLQWLAGPSNFPVEYAAYCILQALLLVGSLWVFRVAGYRLRVSKADQTTNV